MSLDCCLLSLPLKRALLVAGGISGIDNSSCQRGNNCLDHCDTDNTHTHDLRRKLKHTLEQ
jgi:hypothetical protein